MFREKCKHRQCPRVNSKYLRNVQGQVQPTMITNNETTDDGIDTDDEPLKEIVNEVFDRAWVIISNTISAADIKENTNVESNFSIKKPKIFPCETCGKLFAQFKTATKHCKVVHEAKSVACPNCGKNVPEKRNLKRHMSSCTTPKSPKKVETNECPGCGKLFSSKQRLQTHLASKHGVDQEVSAATQVMKCPVCSFTHVKWNVVKVHISKAHTQGMKLNCDLCEFSCGSKSGMWKHVANVHRTNPAGQNRMEKNQRFDIKSSMNGSVHGHTGHAAGGSAPSRYSQALPTSDYKPQTASCHPSAHDLPLPLVDLMDNTQASPMAGHSIQHHPEEYNFPAPAIFNLSQPSPMTDSIIIHNQSRELEMMAQNFEIENYFQLNRIETTHDGKTMYSL